MLRVLSASRVLRQAIPLFALGLLASLSADAQTSRGTITGIVSDATRSVIAGASVELTSRQTSVARTTTTNEAGLYRFDAVDLGEYDIKVTAQGFQTLIRRNVPVQAGQEVAVDAQLEVGQTSSTVEVTAEAALLQTEAPVRGANITPVQITQLPVFSRNPVFLALTLPGVSSNRFGVGIGSFSVNGSRGRSNNFLIDGSENNDISVAGQALQITNPDTVAEVSVQTSNFDSEFGRAAGAVVNTITRSGTNEFHGTASYLLDVSNDEAITNTQSRDPQIAGRGKLLPGTEQFFAGTFGGPIVRNRTFFFGGWQEQRRNNAGFQQNFTTLSASGAQTLRTLFPQGANANVDRLLAGINGQFATAQLSDVALGLGRPDVQVGSRSVTIPQKLQNRQPLVRVDHSFSERDQLSGRFIFDETPDPIGGGVGFEGFTTSFKSRFINTGVTETHIFSPSLTNELRLLYNRIELDFPFDPTNELGRTLPVIRVVGLSDIGVATNIPQGRIANNYSLQDTVSYIRGNHTFRTGFDLLRQRSRQFAPIVERGQLVYQPGGDFTSLGNYVDDFLGSAGSVRRDFGSPAYYPSLLRQAYFFQDRWKATQNLTLTLGLRYEYFGLPINSIRTPAYAGIFNVDPQTGLGPYAEPNEVEADKNNFAPSVGIAYSPDVENGLLGRLLGRKKTVIRTGYQIGYDSFFNNIASNAATSSPNLVATQVDSVVSTDNPRGLGGGFGRLPTTPRALRPSDAQTLVIKNLVNPYTQRWSFGVQRELPGAFVLDVSYVGSKGTRLFINEDLNPLVPANFRITPAGARGPNVTLTNRLDNISGDRTIRTNGGSSTYHAGQAYLQRRFRNGLQLSASYTFSKLIDNGSEVFALANTSSVAAVPSIFGGQPLERGVSLFDRTHRASFTYVYQLPFFRNQNGLVGHLLGGWEVSGVTEMESGVPYTVANGPDADGFSGASDRPDVNPNGRPGVRAIPNSGSPTGFVNPDNVVNGVAQPIDRAEARYIGLPANTNPAGSRTGTLGRNTERTPGLHLWNVNAFKTTRITERVNLEFRTEFFNVFNRPNYGFASPSPFQPAVGTTIGGLNNVASTPATRFLNFGLLDGGGRAIRYQLKLRF